MERNDNETAPDIDVNEIGAAVELAAKLLDDEEFVRKYAVNNPTVERVIIDAYLRGIQKGTPSVPQGGAPLSPRKKPKTLQEAKQLCELYLSRL